ncbi:unnamed protein product [Peronospora belbahrii]|uniref:Uncharacterized protein n=1 Tax=Peronospora belbahrii TaxID=622444 RepID=A0AAU9L0Q0_9STRA|nr:unnamed protein product [Peronospora belbahrii]CAH0515340.1 unnamed protein product [Peronospora belbahrii]
MFWGNQDFSELVQPEGFLIDTRQANAVGIVKGIDEGCNQEGDAVGAAVPCGTNAGDEGIVYLVRSHNQADAPFGA